MKLRALVPVVLLAAPVAVVAACYGATSMRVEVLTDVSCGQQPHALVFTGSEADALGDTNDCKPSSEAQTLGTLLFAPKNDRTATVKVRVRMSVDGKDPNLCDEATDQGRASCVFASRRFSYTEHESRSLSVRMYGACIGKTCPDGSTCVPSGSTYQCVSDQVSCQGGDCGIPGETTLATPPVDASVPLPVDASRDALPSVEAGVFSCQNPVNGSDLFVDGVFRADNPKPNFTSNHVAAYWVQFNPTTLKKLDLATRLVSDVDTNPTVPVSAFDATAKGVWSARPSGTVPGKSDLFFDNAAAPNGTGMPLVSAMTLVAAAAGSIETVYFASGSTIYQKQVGQGTPMNFSSTSNGLAVLAMVHDATDIYWLAGNATASSLDYHTIGAPAATGAQTDGTYAAIASNGKTVVYALTTGEVGKIVNHAASAITTPPGGTPIALAVDDTYVYWSNAEGIARTALAGGAAVETLHPASSEALAQLAVTSTTPGCVYYWTKPNVSNLEALHSLTKP